MKNKRGITFWEVRVVDEHEEIDIVLNAHTGEVIEVDRED